MASCLYRPGHRGPRGLDDCGSFDRLAQSQRAILGRVVHVDMQVALRPHLEVDEAVPGKGIQHMVEETDAGFNIGLACAVEVDSDRYIGLSRLAAYGRSTSLGHRAPR